MASFENIVSLLSLETIVTRLSTMEKDEMMNKLIDLTSVYPFSDYEFVISQLIWMRMMSVSEYENMREQYIQRNYYLHTYEMAWKSVWTRAEQLIISWWHWLKKPSKNIDVNYWQQTSYDAYMNYWDTIIRVEIKASRVTESWNDVDIFIDKALFSDTNKSFWMNFQQLKPQYCDVFIFIAIFRDKLKYRIISSDEVKNYWSDLWDNGKFSKWQHSWNSWNEWQLHIRETNINDFDKYLTNVDDIKESIIEAYERQVIKNK